MPQLQGITPVNSSAQVTKLSDLPLYANKDGKHSSVIKAELMEAEKAKPKVTKCRTPRTVLTDFPDIKDTYTEATSKDMDASNLANIRTLTIGGNIVTPAQVVTGIINKLYGDGTHTRPEYALAYASLFNKLTTVLVEYAKELGETKRSANELTKHNQTCVIPLQQELEKQLSVEQAFLSHFTTWEEESQKRADANKLARMSAKFEEFEKWEAEQAQKSVKPKSKKATTK